MLVEIIHRDNVRVCEQGRNARRLKHVDEDEMLTANEVHIAHETFRQQMVVQRGQENQQCAMAQSQADKRADLVVIRSNDVRLKSIKRVATGTEVRFAVFGAHESFDLIGECEQPKEIALLLGGQAKD